MKFTVYTLIFYFTFGACIPKCDFSQLLKINDLLEHYELHQKEAIALGKKIDFLDFLHLHFFNVDEHQHDSDNNHDNLPLQNVTTTVILCTAVPQLLNISSNNLIERILPSSEDIHLAKITFDIFHPPRFA